MTQQDKPKIPYAQTQWTHLLLEALKEDQHDWLMDQTMEDLINYTQKAEEMFFQQTEQLREKMMDDQSNSYKVNVQLHYKVKEMEKELVYELIAKLAQNPNLLSSLISEKH